MKKQIIGMIMLLVVASYASAETLSRVQSQAFKMEQKRVLNVSTTEVEDAINAIVIVDTNVTTTVTAYTPNEVGQILIGGAGTGTNAIWYASGTTTNDWKQLSAIAE